MRPANIFSNSGPSSKGKASSDEKKTASSNNICDTLTNAVVEISKSDDSFLAKPLIAIAEHFEEYPRFLPQVVNLFKEAIQIARTEKDIERAAEGIALNAWALPLIEERLKALGLAVLYVPAGSQTENLAHAALVENAAEDPEILKLKEYFENKDFSDTHPHKPKSWSLPKGRRRNSLQ